jgi:quercetin dioxygenase-like cupin family protein
MNGEAMQTIVPAQVPVADNPHGIDVRHLYTTSPLVSASLITLQPGEAVNPHKAPVDVFFYVLEGTVVAEIEGETLDVAADTLVPSTAGNLHGFRNEGPAQARLLVVRTPNPMA